MVFLKFPPSIIDCKHIKHLDPCLYFRRIMHGNLRLERYEATKTVDVCLCGVFSFLNLGKNYDIFCRDAMCCGGERIDFYAFSSADSSSFFLFCGPIHVSNCIDFQSECAHRLLNSCLGSSCLAPLHSLSEPLFPTVSLIHGGLSRICDCRVAYSRSRSLQCL